MPFIPYQKQTGFVPKKQLGPTIESAKKTEKEITPGVPMSSLARTDIKEKPTFGSFLKDEIMGGATKKQVPEKGIAKVGAEILQRTVGSKGLLGVAQMPGRVIESALLAGDQKKLAETNLKTAELANKLMDRMKKMPEGEKKEKQKDILQQAMKQISIGQDVFNETGERILTPGEAVSTSINAALTAWSSTQGISTSLKEAAGRGAIMGAGYSGARGIEERNKPMEIAKKALIGGLVGTATSSAIYGVRTGINYLTEKLPEKLYDDALRVGKKTLDAGRSPSKVLLDENHFGTLGSLKKTAEEGIQKVSESINDKLANTDKTISSQDIIDQAVKRLGKNFSQTHSEEQLKEAISKVPINLLQENADVSMVDANQLRQQLDQMVRWEGNQLPAITKTAIKAVSNSLRENIQQSTDTAGEFSLYSNYLKTDELISDIFNKSSFIKGLNIRMSDLYLPAIVGAAKGIPLGIMTLVLESPFAKTLGAVGLNNLGNFIEKLPTETATKTGETALINYLSNLIGK